MKKTAIELMTEHAKRAEGLKLAVEAACAQTVTGHRVEVTRPDQSTGGGMRALQRICLVPDDGASVVVGEADTKARRAELRTLGLVQTLSERRFGRDVRVSGEEYLLFLDKATRVLEEFGLKVEVSALPRAPEPAPTPRSAARASPARPGPAFTAWVFAAAAIGLAALVFWRALH